MRTAEWLKQLQDTARKNSNMFAVLMGATKYCSLGQLTAAMIEEGGSIGGICRHV